MDPVAHFTPLAHYNQWATARLLDVVRSVPDVDYRRDVGLFFKSIHGTLNHLLVGEHHLWFVRFSEGISPQVTLDARLREGCARWAPLIASQPAQRWSSVFEYTTMRGQAVSLPFAATLGHVFNHSTHHRGQITAALTALGHACPELDYVYFLQNPTQA